MGLHVPGQMCRVCHSWVRVWWIPDCNVRERIREKGCAYWRYWALPTSVSCANFVGTDKMYSVINTKWLFFHPNEEIGKHSTMHHFAKFNFTARKLKSLKPPWKAQAVQTTNYWQHIHNHETLHDCYVDSKSTHTTASRASSTWIETKDLSDGRKDIQSKLL